MAVKTSRDRTLVTLALLRGEDMARGLIAIRQLKRCAIGPRNKSGEDGKGVTEEG
jgi:hypothetical protein